MKKETGPASLTYRTRLVIICLLLVTIPVGTVSAISIPRSYSQLESSVQAQADQSVSYLNNALGNYFADIGELTVLPLYDAGIIQILMRYTSDNDSAMTFSDRHQLISFLTNVNFDESIVSQVELYMMNGSYAKSNGMTYDWSAEDAEWMSFCDKDRYRAFVIEESNTIYACRALEQPLYGALMGYIRVKLNPASIDSLIQSIRLPQGSKIYIYNEFDQFIYPLGQHDDGILTEDVDGDRYCYSIATSESTNLSIQVRLSRDTILSEVRMQCVQLGILYAAMLLVGWMLAYYASNYMTRPIINLKEKMELVGRGQFNTRMSVHSNDEIGQLEAMFNSMTENVETLIHEVYDVSLASRDAQISALQSQINPHFLYNTLETINMMAISAGNYDISEAVSNLGQMMRYCVSNENHFATLREEFQFVSAYYDIQKLRDDTLRSLQIECTPQCQTLTVPKLLLQPFVENIVQHGLGDHAVDILIHAYTVEKDLHITIENNGLPMTQEAREKLYRSFLETEQPTAPKSKTGKGYGLANVHRRLQLLYGTNYGIHLDEAFVHGAKFEIRLKREGKHNV